MKTIPKTIALILILILGGVIGQFGKDTGKKISNFINEDTQEKTIENALLEISNQVNSQLPLMIDEETRCETTFVSGKKIFYKYTMINLASDIFDKIYFENELNRNTKNNLCTDEKTIKMLNFGVEYNFMYFDKDGKSIVSIYIDKATCGL